MSGIKLITVCSHPEYAGVLVNSATRHHFEVVVVQAEWKGFGTKIIELYNYLKAHPEVTEFIFADAFDVLVLGDVIEFDSFGSDMLFSCEKNCWPLPELASQYPATTNEWKYLNSGLFYAKSDKWISMVEDNFPGYEVDDQLYYTNLLLTGEYGIALNRKCDMFQCYSFIADDDFTYDDEGLYNRKTNTYPIFVHGNGRTDMTPLNRYL